MEGQELYEWAAEAQPGDEVTIGVDGDDWLEGTVERVEETDDGREIHFEKEEYDRYLLLTDQELQVHVDIQED